MSVYHAASGSAAEDLFIELFSDAFGAEKAGYLYSQYHFYDIYQNSRYADFMIENGGRRVAIEIDDEASHNRQLVSSGKFCDDLLKQTGLGCVPLGGASTADPAGAGQGRTEGVSGRASPLSGN